MIVDSDIFDPFLFDKNLEEAELDKRILREQEEEEGTPIPPPIITEN